MIKLREVEITKTNRFVKPVLNITNGKSNYFSDKLNQTSSKLEYRLPHQYGLSAIAGTTTPQVELDFYSVIEIQTLISLRLLRPLNAVIETDGGGFIARTTDLPLYGYDDNPYKAIQNLKHEIEELYYELNEDDNFSEEWLNYKEFLNTIIKKH